MPGIAAKKICLIRTSALGDTVHALSFVNALRRGYPDAHLTWVLQTFPYEMVKHQPAVDRFITFDRNGGPKDWLTRLSLFTPSKPQKYSYFKVLEFKFCKTLL